MIKVGLKEANQFFSKYIKMVKNGKEIILTDRGRPFAVIKPINHKMSEEDKIRQLEDQGILKPAKRDTIPLHKMLTLRGKTVSEVVAELREERL